ncbi:MAG: type II secretion system F family protein [Verrucomicrobiota bacterium]
MGHLSPIAKSQLYGKLEKYARSGMGMERACQSLLEQPRLPDAEAKIYNGLLSGLSEGKSIGGSLAEASGDVSKLESEVITASESGGQLEKGFRHLADYFRRVHRTRQKVRKGLAYPIVLIHLAVPICTLATTAFASFSPERIYAERSIFSETLRQSLVSFAWLYTIAFVVLLVGWLIFKFAHHISFADALLSRVPLIGRVHRMLSLERFCRVFEIFLLSGSTMSQALGKAGAASASGAIRSAAKRGTERIEQGSILADVFFQNKVAFPSDLARGIAAAEETGMLDQEFDSWSLFYGASAEEAMDKLGEWVPRLFYWVILVTVAYLIVRSAIAYRDLLMELIDFSF